MSRTRSSRAIRSSCAAAAGVLLAGGLWGCDYSLNNDLTIGDDLVLPALLPAETIADPSPLPPGVIVGPIPEPSVVSVTRENWEDTVFLVPIATVEHRAVTSVHPRFTSPETRGVAFPTENTVFGDPLPQRVRRQALEGVAAPFYSGLDLLMAIPRMFVAHPYVVMESPREGYERSPQPLPLVVMADEVVEEGIEEAPEPPPPPPIPPRGPDDAPLPTAAPAEPGR